MSPWRPWSLAALVDATSRVSDDYRVKRFSENTPMTMPERRNDPEREKADGEAVLRHAFHGEPLDPEVARRVRERGAKITEEIYREHGEIDPETINAFFRDDDETRSTFRALPSPPFGSCAARSYRGVTYWNMHAAFSQIDWSNSWECYFGRW
jgi:hypothetical protein